jgi:hypothetical protein
VISRVLFYFINIATSHNIREGKEKGARKVQRGMDTPLHIRNTLTVYVTTSGVNPSGLGCWSWHLLEGEEGYHTRVVTSYAPCDSTESRPDTYYQQKLRYITKKALKTTQKQMFQEDLGPIHSTEEMESKRGQGNTHDRCKQGCT